jgi:hypothetical protein
MFNACAGQKYREMRYIFYINLVTVKTTVTFYCFHHLSVTFQYRNYENNFLPSVSITSCHHGMQHPQVADGGDGL